MLFNPKWDKPHIEDFVSFLASKPANEEYCWNDSDCCAIGQYYKAALGRPYNDIWMNGWELDIASPKPHTFGAALERAKKQVPFSWESGNGSR